jgi:propionyl-CoA carboxylase alpha chain
MEIKKLLIANRGEIACRVIKTAKKLGITTVAVFSDADKDALYVAQADEAIALNGNTASETYLNIEKIIQAAKESNCDAIHPGYGFLSENATFASECEQNSIIFVGPSSQAIRLMGSKLKAKEIAQKVGVPTLEATNVTAMGETELLNFAKSLSYPVLIKASAGGGGRGMRIVTSAFDFKDAVESAKREAESAFGDRTVFVERYLENPRHIEIQILIDSYGNGYSLFERECSIQRRHQKIIEESPSVALSEKLRIEMGEKALALAKEVGYTNAGTVEFIFQDDSFYFLEVNTRLQVEHPVTELITGLDLVELQLKVAQGQELEHLNILRNGHAIEARLCAEDPQNDYAPQAGKLIAFNFESLEGVRVDSGFKSSSEIPPFYDSLLAKVIAWGRNRNEAISRLHKALSSAEIFGVKTNRDLLCAILTDQDFLRGDISTSFLIKKDPVSLIKGNGPNRDIFNLMLAATALCYLKRSKDLSPLLKGVPIGFRNVFSQPLKVTFQDSDNNQYDVNLTFDRYGSCNKISINDIESQDVEIYKLENDFVDLRINKKRLKFKIYYDDDQNLFGVCCSQCTLVLKLIPALNYATEIQAPGSLNAPMPGSVIKIAKNLGEKVNAGDPIVFIEAMKMEHAVRSPSSGILAEINVEVGQQVATGQQLAIVKGD